VSKEICSKQGHDGRLHTLYLHCDFITLIVASQISIRSRFLLFGIVNYICKENIVLTLSER
jgi:hypothetical protein